LYNSEVQYVRVVMFNIKRIISKCNNFHDLVAVRNIYNCQKNSITLCYEE